MKKALYSSKPTPIPYVCHLDGACCLPTEDTRSLVLCTGETIFGINNYADEFTLVSPIHLWTEWSGPIFERKITCPDCLKHPLLLEFQLQIDAIDPSEYHDLLEKTTAPLVASLQKYDET